MLEDTLLMPRLTLVDGDAEIAAALRLARRWSALRAEAVAATLDDRAPVDALVALIAERTVLSARGVEAAWSLADALEAVASRCRMIVQVPVYNEGVDEDVRVGVERDEVHDDRGLAALRHRGEVATLADALDDALDWIVARSATLA